MHARSLCRPLLHASFFLFALLHLGDLANSQVSVVEWIEGSKVDSSPKQPKIDFEKDVSPLLERRCAGCHVGEHAKGGFHVTDRDSLLGYVEPGDVQNSSLWVDYLTADSAHVDPSSLVMPLNGPISSGELAIVEDWIKQGAEWPETYRFVSTTGVPSVERKTIEPEGFIQRVFAFSGYFHPAVVHFPIALLLFGGASAALSLLTGGRAVYVAYYCLVWGTLFSIMATYMGWCLAAEKGYPDWMSVPTDESIVASSAVFRHRWLGIFTTLAAIVVTIIASFALRSPKSSFRYVWRIGLIAVAILVSIAGHQGGELVYGDIIGKAFSRLVGESR